MHLSRLIHRRPGRARRSALGLLLLATLASLLVSIAGTSPAGAVPVDGRFTGTLTATGSAPLTVSFTSGPPGRTGVSATVTIGAGASVDCFGARDLASSFSVTGTGGIASAAAPTPAN